MEDKEEKKKLRYTSDRAIRMAVRICKNLQIRRIDIVAYILNKFVYNDETSISNEHIVKHLLSDRKTVIRIVKALEINKIVNISRKVFEKDGCIKTSRIFKVNQNLIQKYIDEDLVRLGKNPSQSSVVITKVEKIVEPNWDKFDRAAEAQINGK